MLRTTVIVALLLASAAGPPPAVPDPIRTTPFTSEAAPITAGEKTAAGSELLPFTTDKTDRMTVGVRIGESGPFLFLVDTGSERTSISRQLATRLGLLEGPGARVHSVLGSKNVATVNIPRMAVGKQALSVPNAPIFEESHLGADGLIGLDSLRSQRVTFDFKAGEMHIVPSRYERVGIEDENTIVIKARARHGRLILTSARIDGMRIPVILDTGAQVSIGNFALRRKLELAGRIAPIPTIGEASLSGDASKVAYRGKQAIIESVTGEVRTVNLAEIDRLDLGGVELRKLGIAFASVAVFKHLGYDKKPALLLGMDAMRTFDRIAIDFAQKKVRFVTPSVGMLDDYQTASVAHLVGTDRPRHLPAN